MQERESLQAEVDLQADELAFRQKRIEAGRRRYWDFYNLLPVGYATLDAAGRVLAINLTGAELLAATQRDLAGRSFAGFVAESCRKDFQHFWKRLFQSGRREECHVILAPAGRSPLDATLVGTTVPDPRERRLCHIALMDVTGQARVVKELEKSREELRALAIRLQAVREEERALLAREIHDELSGNLTALKMDLSLLPDRAANDRRLFLEKLDSMRHLIDNTLSRVRSIVTELHPVVLDRLGLVAAMEWQAREFQERSGIVCESHLPADEIPLESDRAAAVFRIFQEALTNVARHAAASKVVAELRKEGKVLVLSVRDDGVGIDERKIFDHQSIGLIGMRERALSFGGATGISRLPWGGTLVGLKIPIE
jgi:signal transduction histidine kinase